MEQEKTEQKATGDFVQHHRRGPMKLILGLLFVFVIAGIAYGCGRISSRGRFFGNNYYRGGIMMGARDVDESPNYSRGMMGRGRFGAGGDISSSRLNAISGQISAINNDNITVKDVDGTEYTVNVLDTTSIVVNNKIDKFSNLKVNNSVIVRGNAKSNGTIDASVIRTI